MARTTIDGLKVRDTQPNRAAHVARRSTSTHAIDMTTRSRTERRAALNSINEIKRKNPSVNSFLDPVKTFDFDAESRSLPDDDFSLGAEADWSELLENQAGNTPQYNNNVVDNTPEEPEDEFLSSWNDNGQKEFLARDLIDDEELEPEEPAPKRKKSRPAKKKRHIGRAVTLTVLALLVVGGGIIYKWGDELIARLTGGRSGLWDAIHSMVSDAVPFETDSNGRTNVLVFGTEGYNMSGDTAYGEHGGSQLTDSIMVISLDQETKDVALLSLPRDLKVSMACSAGKINEVFWCHNQDGTNEEAGAQALMDQIGTILGIKFQYYAHVNWASLIDIIDTIGGITVTLDEDINDYGWTNAVAKAGVPIDVNGEQALGLARARHGTQGGDFTRGNTQQKIVEGIVNKIMKKGIGVTEALNLVNILGDNLRSNFSTDNIKAGVKVLSDFNIANIRQVPLVNYDTQTFYMTTATINNISYVVPSAGEGDYSQIRRYVAEMFSSDPTAREHARIMVYNASGQYGVAGAEKDKLAAAGFDDVAVGDAELGTCNNQYCVYAVGQDFPATKAALEDRYKTTVKGVEELPENVQPGDVDFVIIIGVGGSEV